MKYWLLVLGVWMALSGATAVLLVLLLDLPLWGDLTASGIVGAGLCWFFLTREVEAESLKMRESSWNTPEDEDLLT